jgi:2-keto-4-pentenoate hydratase/2-oxohepta-3-ene-1,7-dioic acid hydratase in catechol pathway
MKITRFIVDGEEKFGLLEDGAVAELKGNIFDKISYSGRILKPAGLKFLAPCVPSKIVAIGLNYADHAAEMKKQPPADPLIFLKPSTAVIGPDEDIVLPKMSKRVDYEAELAFVIKKTAKNVKEEDAGDYILGYTCFNDVTARDLQATDGQWSRAKGFDTFAPLGPRICTDVKPDNLKIECVVNGKVRQSSNTKNFIFPVPRLLSFVSSVMTLLPGDVVATGTPAGIGQINPGDVVEVRIDKIGILKNKVRSE